MRNKINGTLPVLLLAGLIGFSGHARAGQIGVGLLVVDVPDTAGDANSYELDTYNLTDLNDSAFGGVGGGLSDPFPIATQLLTDITSTVVTAADGTTTLASLGSAYYSLSLDGQSLTGGGLFAGFTDAADSPGSVAIITAAARSAATGSRAAIRGS